MSLQTAMAWRALGMLARVREARELMQHSGLYGEHNEGLLIETLREFLPTEWEIGSGEIIDVDGARSPQCDVIVYNAHTFPPAHRSKAGKVLVFAHAVGAVIEVKTMFHSATTSEGTGDVQEIGSQLAALRSFLDAAITKGNSSLHQEASEQSVDPTIFDELGKLEDRRIALYGFAYGSTVSATAIAGALPAIEESPQVFVLDTPRSAIEIQDRWSGLAVQGGGSHPTKEATLRFAEELREPNGASFEAHAYNNGVAQVATVQVDATLHGAQALRTFIKELSDTLRRSSPLGHTHSSMCAEIVYSVYNPWAGTYS